MRSGDSDCWLLQRERERPATVTRQQCALACPGVRAALGRLASALQDAS